MIVEANGLKKSFGSKIVLDGLDLKIPESSVYGLVGKNGAGKTTFLNILAGLSEATAGECFVSGQKVCRGHYSLGTVSYLPDLPSFFDYLSVQEYLQFILSADKTKKRYLTSDVEKIIDRIGINGKTRIRTLSRGNRQKLGIFASVMTEPKLLILDEPTSALDPVGRREVMSLIQDLRSQGMAILFSTHILSDLEIVCDKIGFLHKGIIQREIDMNMGTEHDAYELILQQSDVNQYSSISQILEDYDVEYIRLNDGSKLICKPKNGSINQADFFSLISCIDADVLSVKRVSRNDLESIMVEVLST